MVKTLALLLLPFVLINNVWAQSFDISYLNLPPDTQLFERPVVASPAGRSLVLDSNKGYFLLRDGSISLFPESLRSFSLIPLAVSSNGNVLIADNRGSGPFCRLLVYPQAGEIKEISKSASPACDYLSGSINDAGEVEFSFDDGQYGLKNYFYSKTVSLISLPTGASAERFKIIHLTESGVAIGRYTTPSSQVVFFKYTPLEGSTGLPDPENNLFIDEYYLGHELPSGELTVYDRGAKANLWNPFTGKVSEANIIDVLPYLNLDQLGYFSFDDSGLQSPICSFSNNLGIDEIALSGAGLNGEYLVQVYSSNPQGFKYARLVPNRQPAVNHCLKPSDLRITLDKECKRFVQSRSSAGILFRRNAPEKNCIAVIQLKIDKAISKNFNVARNVYSNKAIKNKRKKINANGKAKFDFRIKRKVTTEFVVPDGDNFYRPLRFSIS